MTDPYTDQAKALAALSAENGVLRAEIELLRGFQDAAADLEDRLEAALAEIERLRAALDGIDQWSMTHEDARSRARAALAGKP